MLFCRSISGFQSEDPGMCQIKTGSIHIVGGLGLIGGTRILRGNVGQVPVPVGRKKLSFKFRIVAQETPSGPPKTLFGGMFLSGQPAGHPLVEQKRWAIHRRREPPAVEPRRATGSLHPLDNPDILDKHTFPLLGVLAPQVFRRVRPRIVDVNMLQSPARPLGFKNDSEDVIALDAKKDIRGDGQVFARRVPLFGQSGEIR